MTKGLDFGKVAVLYGGRSGEREVSLRSGAGVLAALQRQGIDAHAFDPAERSLDELKGFNRAFISLHGKYGEDGTIQGALELMGIPYTGPGVMASAIGMDKWRCKLLWEAVGLPVPEYAILTADTDFDDIETRFGFPLFVKPACEGSSLGVTMVKKPGQLARAYEVAAEFHDMVLVEKALLGGEFTTAILGDRALPIIKIEPNLSACDFYDYEAKYNRNDTTYRVPCGLPAAKEAEIRELCRRAYQVIGARGWGRVDFLMDSSGKAYMLEVNTSPGMTDHSLVPMAAKAEGMDYDALVVEILKLATLGV